MIDTHTHLYLDEFSDSNDCRGAVERALNAGVSHMVFPNCDLDTVAPMMQLHAMFPDSTSVAMGLHPTSVFADWRSRIETIDSLLDKGGWVAVGEVGIDLYWDKTFRLEQMDAFRHQLRRAAELSLPVIIHCREGLDETLQCIADTGSQHPPLIFHSFTGTPADVQKVRSIVPEAMFGINGVATFKNAASVREAVEAIGLHHILLETDSPYLAPVPYRGRRNESSYLPAVAHTVAQTLGCTVAEVDAATTATACKVFNLKPV